MEEGRGEWSELEENQEGGGGGRGSLAGQRRGRLEEGRE